MTVTGNATYGPVSFTPDAPGTYHWKAQYIPATGDPNNIGSTHNAACNDADETVIVRTDPDGDQDAAELVSQRHRHRSSATIGNLGAGGTVVFSLYDNGDMRGGHAVLHPVVQRDGWRLDGDIRDHEHDCPDHDALHRRGELDQVVLVEGRSTHRGQVTQAHTGIQSTCNAEHFDDHLHERQRTGVQPAVSSG